MRVAIAHHWFVTKGGGERVAEYIASLFPAAEIFSLVSHPEGIPEGLRERRIRTSFLQKLPFGVSHHRHMMPLYAAAAEGLDLRGFDVVLSSDSGPVKCVRTDPDATHICYCHSPMRYLYDGYDQYRALMGPLTRTVFTATAGSLRKADLRAAARVTHFIANSQYVADRIRRVYGRESTVIHPPIDVKRAVVATPGPHYLCAGRLVSYKRTDLIVKACTQLGRPLRIVGAGPEEAALKRIAGPTVTFDGEQTTENLWREFATCRALIFAADEDFGMVPLEAQACGRPVIAYGHGGSLETVRGSGARPTGVYFSEQTVESVMEGILRFEENETMFDSQVIRSHAAQFDSSAFLERLRMFITSVLPAAANEMSPTANEMPADEPAGLAAR